MLSLRHLNVNGVWCKPGVAGKDLIAVLLDDATNAIHFGYNPSDLSRHPTDDASDRSAKATTTDVTRGPEEAYEWSEETPNSRSMASGPRRRIDADRQLIH